MINEEFNKQFASHTPEAIAQKETRETESAVDAEAADLLWDAIVGGAVLKDIHGVPDKVMEAIYAYAYDFYQLGRSKDAEVFFRFLCTYDTYNADYVMGLAATFQQQQQHQKAIQAYMLAFALRNDDYRPLLHAGQCCLLMKHPEEARECFTAVVKGSAPAPLKAQAQAYLAAIKPTENKEESHA